MTVSHILLLSLGTFSVLSIAVRVSINTHASLPGVVHGWNTSISSAYERVKAANKFGVHVSMDEGLWTKNALTPYVGKTLRMTGIKIQQRNAFNTVIETAVNNGEVLWTLVEGERGIIDKWVEHINGGYTGTAHIAGWVSSTTFIENDVKSVFGQSFGTDDWGIVTVTDSTASSLTFQYQSYKKGRFIMEWTLQDYIDLR